MTIRNGEMTLDFTGSAPQRRGNINAVAPMTHSAAFFAVQLYSPAVSSVKSGSDPDY